MKKQLTTKLLPIVMVMLMISCGSSSEEGTESKTVKKNKETIKDLPSEEDKNKRCWVDEFYVTELDAAELEEEQVEIMEEQVEIKEEETEELLPPPPPIKFDGKHIRIVEAEVENVPDITDDQEKITLVVEEEVVEEVAEEVVEDNQVYITVEQKPVFPGGDAGLLKYISENVKYPTTAQEKGVQGRVVLQFVVEKDGSVGQVNVTRGAHPDLDKEAIRVVKSLPRFVPGKQKGRPVRVWYTLPVAFKLM